MNFLRQGNLWLPFLCIIFPACSLYAQESLLLPDLRVPYTFSQNDAPISLNLGKQIERKVELLERQSFSFKAKAGEYVFVEINQENLSVRTILFTANGQSIFKDDDFLLWPKSFSFILEQDGTFRVQIMAVRVYEAVEQAGLYTIKLAEKRVATEKDKLVFSAQQHFYSGNEFLAKRYQTIVDYQGIRRRKALEAAEFTALENLAVREYQAALSIWNRLGDSRWEGRTLVSVAIGLQHTESKKGGVLKLYNEALEIFAHSNDLRGQAITLDSLYEYLYIQSLRGSENNIRSYVEQALEVYRKLGDRRNEAVQLERLAEIYTASKQYALADRYLQQELAILRVLKDGKSSEAGLLGQQAKIRFELEDFEKARTFLEQARKIYRESNNKLAEMSLLSNFGVSVALTGKYSEAIQYYKQSLALSRELNKKSSEINALEWLGHIYNDTGNHELARQYYEEARTKSRDDDSYVLFLIGNTYFRTKDYKSAQEYYEKALPLAQKNKNQSNETQILNVLSELYLVNDRVDEALANAEQSLHLARKLRYPRNIAFALAGLGNVETKLGQYDKARVHYEEALAITHKIKNRREEAIALDHLMTLSELTGSNALAIMYGKRAINVLELLRRNIKEIDNDSQRKYLQLVESTYRNVAKLLIDEGRLIEAQTVLDLLKLDEFRDITVRRGAEIPDTVPYSKAESEVMAKVEVLAKLEIEREALLRKKEKEDLEDEKNNGLSPAEEMRLDWILREIEDANRAFRLSIEAVGKAGAVDDHVARLNDERNLQGTLKQLQDETGSNVVAIYTVLGKEDESGQENSIGSRKKFGWIILVAPNFRKAYPIDMTDLEQTVFQLRESLRSDKYDPQPLAEKLYTKLFRHTSPKQKVTLEADLETLFVNSNSKTLMWSLDGVLRYVPMAALHDGKGYLVEKYRNTVFTKQSSFALNNKDKEKWQALGLGVSTGGTNYSALPGVEKELRDIVREPASKTGVIEGAIKMNSAFAKATTIKLWQDGKYPVVHIASHYKFNAADPRASFLLVGDGYLSFAEMQDKDNLFGSVDLLSLSACDTAVTGNGKEAEGFAWLAQSLGAKSVVASLWPVSDAGTSDLMVHFYDVKIKNPSMPKGEAFRQAQLRLLTGSGRSDNPDKSVPIGRQLTQDDKNAATLANLKLFIRNPEVPFSHPFYWSSFVMIGNWK